MLALLQCESPNHPMGSSLPQAQCSVLLQAAITRESRHALETIVQARKRMWLVDSEVSCHFASAEGFSAVTLTLSSW